MITQVPKAQILGQPVGRFDRGIEMKVRPFRSPAEFRAWLEKNHDQVQERWVGFYNQRANKTGITYPQAVDEALCFGWIDGVRRSVSETVYAVRFTPRKAKSKWSAVNLKRATELKKLERMAPPGLKTFEQRVQKSAEYSYEERPRKLGPRYERQFKANAEAWEFFRAEAPWYQRTSSFWVMSAKKEETREKRLQVLIADSGRGRRLGMLTPKGKK